MGPGIQMDADEEKQVVLELTEETAYMNQVENKETSLDQCVGRWNCLRLRAGVVAHAPRGSEHRTRVVR